MSMRLDHLVPAVLVNLNSIIMYTCAQHGIFNHFNATVAAEAFEIAGLKEPRLESRDLLN